MKTFGSYHPVVLLLYFISVLLVAMFVQNPILQITAMLGGILFSIILLPRREIISNIKFYIPTFIIITITNPLFSHNGITPIFFLNGKPVTAEALLCGAAISIMVVGVMLWFRCYTEIMTSDKFIYLFGKAIPKLSLVISMAMRFVPQFKHQMYKVSRAQKAMGLYSSRNLTDRIRNTMRVFISILSWSIESSMETSNSMKARGYGIKNRTCFSLFRFHFNDGILLLVCLILLGTVLTGAAMGKLAFHYYPKISEINISAYAIFTYFAFGILCLLPFIIEVKEVLVWKYYISKT